MTTTYQAKCARCDVPLGGDADAGPHTVFSCPRCGISDTFENIEREIGEYIAEKVSDSLDKMFEDAARGNPSLKYKKDYRPHKTYRFVVDYKP